MQLTKGELQRNIAATNKEAYFLKGNNKILVVNIPSGDLRFAIDLERLTPFLLEYLTYYPQDGDRETNVKFNKDKYGVYDFLLGEVDTATVITTLRTKSNQFDAWYAIEENAAKLTATFDSAILDGIMEGLGMTDEEVFYLVRDDAQQVSGIDLSDIKYETP